MTDKKISGESYLQRRNLVIEFINNNLDKKISISDLAKISHLSPFHFHRIMKALLGEPIGNFIMRTRVETAARLIRYTELEIKEIAYSVAYESPSSLNKIFKQFYGISPTEYRTNKKLTIVKPIIKNSNIQLKEPKIISLPKKKVIYINITGEYGNENYNKTWQELWNFVKENKLFTKGIENLGISYDDPNVTESEKCRYDACLTIHKPVEPHGKVGVKETDGGKFAAFLYQGSYEYLGDVYDAIFSDWLINSEYELRNIPVMEKYLNNPNRTEANKLKTEIYLPIK